MRLEPILPEKLSSDVRMLHDEIARGMNSHLSSFISARRDGALVGPFPPMLHFPEFGKAAWRNVEALIDNAKLPKTAHEVAILATRAAFGSRCELYAHARVAKGVGLTPSEMVSWLPAKKGDPVHGLLHDWDGRGA